MEGARHRGNGRLVQHVVHAGHRALRHRRLSQIPFVQFCSGKTRQVRALSGDEAVDDAHTMAATDQFLREVRSDEAGAAGDEDHGAPEATGVTGLDPLRTATRHRLVRTRS